MVKWGTDIPDAYRQVHNRPYPLQEMARNARKRRYIGNAIYAALIIALAVGAVVLYQGLKTDDTQLRRSIQQCINDGGDPKFSVNKNGEITAFFGCVKP